MKQFTYKDYDIATGIDVYIAEGWSNILSSLVDQHIEFTMEKKGE